MKITTRLYENIIREHIGMYRQMVFLSGPRQVGKTTLAKSFATDYLNWEEKETRLLVLKGARAVGNSLALEEGRDSGKTLVFDEIHRYQKWKTFLKGFFDIYEKSAKVFATGSAKMDVYKRGGDSMMGRFSPTEYILFRLRNFSIRRFPTKGRSFGRLENLPTPSGMRYLSLEGFQSRSRTGRPDSSANGVRLGWSSFSRRTYAT